MPTTTLSTKILNVGLAIPETQFTQKEIASMMGITAPKALRFFEHEHIKTRHLILPASTSPSLSFKEETPSQLRDKFLHNSLILIEKALNEALAKSNLKKEDINYITCVTSTGFVVPGLSAFAIEKLNLKNNCQRLDIVGMGCNAGLNGLNAVSNWCLANPNKIGVLVCCELCSCIYSMEDSENAAIVNSLFGDGVAACILKSTSSSETSNKQPSIVDFSSHLISNSLPLLRFNWNKEKNRHSFYVDKKTPETLASDINIPLESLLKKNHLKFSDINHWIVHSGGSAILDAIENKMALDKSSFRHTRTVLETLGNISSGSFLFSYQKLIDENVISHGDYGVMITMGPGLTIEMALIKW